jgi:hypothetical protein
MKGTLVNRIFRSCGKIVAITILAAAGLVAAAEAQKPSQPPSPPPKQLLNLHPGNGSSTDAKGPDFQPLFALGWNYVHATNCDVYDSGGSTYVVLYPAEGGWWYTSIDPYRTVLLTACQTGNWIGFNVYDSYGDWSEVYTYDYY